MLARGRDQTKATMMRRNLLRPPRPRRPPRRQQRRKRRRGAGAAGGSCAATCCIAAAEAHTCLWECWHLCGLCKSVLQLFFSSFPLCPNILFTCWPCSPMLPLPSFQLASISLKCFSPTPPHGLVQDMNAPVTDWHLMFNTAVVSGEGSTGTNRAGACCALSDWDRFQEGCSSS